MSTAAEAPIALVGILKQSPRVVQVALALRQGACSPALLLRAARFRQGQKQAMTAIAVLLDACLPFL